MNKLKALLIAGLLSLSSVGFASSVTYIGPNSTTTDAGKVADGAQAGIITLDDFSAVTIRGQFEGEIGLPTSTTPKSAWYEVIVGYDNATFGYFNDTASAPTTFSFFADNGMGGYDATAYSGYADLTGDFIVTLAQGSYKLLLNGLEGRSYDGVISQVPVPAAGILFASALLGAGAFGRRKKKSAKTSMVGAFARAS